VRFDKKSAQVTFECWPRFSAAQQFAGWPITVHNDDNDGRKPVGWLPELAIEGSERAVVQVIADSSGEILYTVRVRGTRFQPPVFSHGGFTVRVGRDRPDGRTLAGLKASTTKDAAGTRSITL
jgi:hypothetical protein